MGVVIKLEIIIIVYNIISVHLTVCVFSNEVFCAVLSPLVSGGDLLSD